MDRGLTRRLLLVGGRKAAIKAARRLGWELVASAEDRPDVVAAVTEGAVLEAAEIRAALGLPGLSAEAAGRCRDKVLMKQAVRSAGIACTDWIALHEASDPASVASQLGLPLFVKGRLASGSRGQRLAHSPSEIRPAAGLIAERRIVGAEMSVESIVHAGEPAFVNCTEYLRIAHANVLPAALDETTRIAVLDLNRRVLRALGIERGLIHLELYSTSEGLLFGELAARPPGGRIMRLLRRVYGFDPWVAHLQAEAGEEPHVKERVRGTAGVWILHPGAGLLTGVEGVAAAAAVPGIRRVRCRVGEGDRVAERLGTGQDVGELEAWGPDRNSVVQALLEAYRHLRFSFAPSSQRVK